jgi:thioesterase domain-containing protein
LKQGIKETVNIFFIHDGTGEVEGYMELCKHLTGEYNCWGIQANRLENAAPQNWSIEELAKKYVQRVKRVRAHGPYYILGWSLGGIIAFEMTSLLEQMNEKINFLALVDSPPPQVKLQPKTTQFNLESELRFIKNYLHGSDLQEKLKTASGVNRLWLSVINYLESNNYDVEMIKKMISEYGMQTLPNYHKLNIKESIYYLNVGRTFRHARALYTPSRKIHTPVNYFSASQSKGIRKKRWNDYCGKSIKFYEITGDHFSILKMPQVLELSKVVDVELKVEKETFPKKNKKVIDMPRIT